MKKKITCGGQARDELFLGAERLINTVRPAIGPSGRKVLSAGPTGVPEASVKSSIIAGKLSFRNVTENAGAILLRRAGETASAKCGDGSATAMVLAECIVREGARLIAAGYSPVSLRRGIEKALPAAVDALKALALRQPAPDQIEQAASLAAKDEVMGKLVCQALSAVGYTGEITVKASDSGESYVCADGSFSIPAGYQSKYMMTNETLQEALLQDAAVFVCGCAINSIQDILPLLDESSIQKKPLFILADSISSAVVKSFVSNIAQGVIRLCSVEAPGVGAGKQTVLEDTAARTGTVVFGTPLHPAPKAARLCDCGRADMVKVTRSRSAIYGGKANPEVLCAHIRHLETLLSLEHNELEDERLNQRLANLQGRNAELRVGAATERERRYLSELAESAIKTARGAAREGLLPGGGTAYLRAVPAVRAYASAFPAEERAGAGILISALEMPIRIVAENAGFDGAAAAAQVGAGEGFFGFNVATGEYCNLAEEGILDSAATLLCALEAAASVGAQLLTVESSVLIDGVPISSLPVPDDLHISPQDFL